MKKCFVFAWLLLSLLFFHLDALNFSTELIHVNNEVLQVNCGESAKSLPITRNNTDDTNLPSTVNAAYLYITYSGSDHCFHYNLYHPITLPGLTGGNHNKPGKKGYITRTCYYYLGYFMYFEPGSSTMTKHYTYTHNNDPLGGEECDHIDEP